MVKREVSSSVVADTHTPSAKRRKEESATNADGREGAENSDQEQEAGGEAGEGPNMKVEEIREEGLKVLQVLKEAKNKEERLISSDFWRLPSKRQFPDYYEIIKRPIALDDIRTNLENSAYNTLEALRQDLEQCFKNAKKYNMRESVIWKDAKTLQKLANKEVDRIRRRYSDEDEEGDGSDSGKKREKGVNIHRLMKNRLQKLVAKTSENDILISAPFMDLPSKRQWPMYYKIIKRPICIEDIFKKIKRKEYHTIPEYVADVDLVFSNAMTFNEEGSEIWNHASILKNYFHQLMSDLPAKYNKHSADPNVEPTPNKIKLKIPGYGSAPHVEANGDTGENGGSVRLRIPTLASENTQVSSATTTNTAAAPTTSNGAAALPAKKAALPQPTASSSQAPLPPPNISAPIPKPAKAISSLASIVAEQHSPIASPAPSTPAVSSTINVQNNTAAQVPPSTFYTPPIASSSNAISATPIKASATPVPTPNLTAPITRNGVSSPKPSLHSAGIHSVRLEVTPTGRRLPLLDLQAGVRNWAVRLGSDEKGLKVKNVKFEKSANGDEGSDEEREKGPMEIVSPPKKRGRGRPRKNPVVDKPSEPSMQEPSETAHDNAIVKKSTGVVPPAENVVVRLDGTVIAHKSFSEPQEGDAFRLLDTSSDTGGTKSHDEWNMNLSSGRHMLEIGRKGNNAFWQVYVYV